MTTHPAFARPQHPIDASQFVITRDFGTFGLESVSQPDTTREGIILDIASGQIDRVVSVIEFNEVEGWSRNITDAIREEVERRVGVLEAA